MFPTLFTFVHLQKMVKYFFDQCAASRQRIRKVNVLKTFLSIKRFEKLNILKNKEVFENKSFGRMKLF